MLMCGASLGARVKGEPAGGSRMWGAGVAGEAGVSKSNVYTLMRVALAWFRQELVSRHVPMNGLLQGGAEAGFWP